MPFLVYWVSTALLAHATVPAWYAANAARHYSGSAGTTVHRFGQGLLPLQLLVFN